MTAGTAERGPVGWDALLGQATCRSRHIGPAARCLAGGASVLLGMHLAAGKGGLSPQVALPGILSMFLLLWPPTRSTTFWTSTLTR